MPVTINGTTGITTPNLNSAGTVTTSSLVNGTALAFRNKIINGAMTIDQRNGGASVTPTMDTYVLDRWRVVLSQSSKFSVQQNAGSVTPPAGFTNYLGVTSLSSYSITSTDTFYLEQRVEGYNIADLSWGTADAKTVTLSFWVRSSLTGTFGGVIRRGTGNIYVFPFSYTISSANTWTQISVSVTAPTSVWNSNTTNDIGLTVFFGLGIGSTYSGTAGSWQASNILGATGATSVVGTNGATFYITGVQLEAGSVATPFENRPIGTELALCQRYYYQEDQLLFPYTFSGYTTNIGVSACKFSVPMRVAPTMAISVANAKNVPSSPYQNPITSISSIDTSPFAFNVYGTLTGISSGLSYACGFTFKASAEL